MIVSALEDQFLKQWQATNPSLLLVREYSAVPTWEADFLVRYSRSKRSKPYRLDFAHPLSCTGIEIQGAVYTRGRHVTGSGYERDCRKYNLAFAAHWTIFLLSASMAKDAFWHRLIASHIAGEPVPLQ